MGPTIMNKLSLTTIVVVGLASLMPGAAQADIVIPNAVKWTLQDVTFTDGGTAAGDFTTNSLGIIDFYDITTSQTAKFPRGTTYATGQTGTFIDTARTTSKFFVIIMEEPPLTGEHVENTLEIGFMDPLTLDFGPNDPVVGSLERSVMAPTETDTGNFERNGTSGEAIHFLTAVEEPSTASVLGAGLLGLVFLWRRRQILGLVQ
jgi:MYXO-CTERM domain-containing protein